MVNAFNLRSQEVESGKCKLENGLVYVVRTSQTKPTNQAKTKQNLLNIYKSSVRVGMYACMYACGGSEVGEVLQGLKVLCRSL